MSSFILPILPSLIRISSLNSLQSFHLSLSTLILITGDMAVVLGNLGLSIDVVSSRTILPERKSRPAIMEGVLSLNSAARRSEGQGVSAFSSGKGLDSDGENRSLRLVVVRGKAKSKMNGVDPDAGWSDEENGSEEMLRRLKEVEERKELEKKAEELQSRMDDAGDGLRRDETDDQKRLRVRKELEKVAKEQAEQRKTAQMMFDLGQKAYGKGMYGRAIEFLEGALTIIPRATLLGGEIQIWLAMAYEANDRHGECIALYKQMEKTHPVVNIRRQAANLRYILEAPKLKISQEEMVTIPLIGSAYDSYAGTWTDKDKDKDKDGRTRKQITSSKDYLGDFLVWRPPTHLEKSQGFWVALGLWLGLVGAALFLQT